VDNKALQNTAHQWLRRKDSTFYHAGIYALVQRWKITAVNDSDYTEK
jgi:hypothetical protein